MPPLLPIRLFQLINGKMIPVSLNARLPVDVMATVKPLDVIVGDQVSPLVNQYFHFDVAETALTNPVAIGTRTATLDSVADINIVNGDKYLSFIADSVYFDCEVLSLPGGNVINIDSPFPAAFPAGTRVIVMNRVININGSVASVQFHVTPHENETFDVTQLRLVIISATEPDDSKFGDLAKLTNGIVFESYIDGIITNWSNVKSNGTLALFGELTYSDKAGGGAFASRFTYIFAGQENSGVAVRLEPGDQLRITVQDDLSGLNNIRAVIRGHVVVP